MLRAEWEGLGVHTRRWHGVGRRCCSLQLAKMLEFSLHPLGPNMLCAYRCDDRIYVDMSYIESSGSLCEVRAQVADVIALYLIDRCNYAVTDTAVHGVALELVLPQTELAAALREANGDVSLVIHEYRDHVPAKWIAAAAAVVLAKVLAFRRATTS